MADKEPELTPPEVKSSGAAPAGSPAAGASVAAPAAQPGRATACAQCGKRLDRKKQYYRNGRYFCNKRCWHTSALGVPPQQTTT